jgi:hypothetical protein
MKTGGNTLSLAVLFYKESICLVSLSLPLANYNKNNVTNKKRGLLALPW